jgi:hypothetical protein
MGKKRQKGIKNGLWKAIYHFASRTNLVPFFWSPAVVLLGNIVASHTCTATIKGAFFPGF